MIRTAKNHSTRSLSAYLRRFKDQPDLTPHLDQLPDEPFSQETVNEIVLWKVNRYVRLSPRVLDSLYRLRRLSPSQHRKGERVLLKLLGTHGVDLPMASTFLRFQNPDVFQIIDRHAYRAAMGKPYALHTATAVNTKMVVYFKDLDTLHELAASSGAAFRDLDRILYIFDKKHNGAIQTDTASSPASHQAVPRRR